MDNLSFIPPQTRPFIHNSLNNGFKWSSSSLCEGQSRPLTAIWRWALLYTRFHGNTSVKEAYKPHTSTLKSVSAHYLTTSEIQNKTY